MLARGRPQGRGGGKWIAPTQRGNTEVTTMTDSLIGKRDIAAMLGTSPGVAAFILEE